MNSISKSVSDCNYQQPVISFRLIPINWQDGTISHVAIVNEPQRQPQTLEDQPIVIGKQVEI